MLEQELFLKPSSTQEAASAQLSMLCCNSLLPWKCLNSFRRGCHFGVLLNPRAGLHLTIALPERMKTDSEAATDHLFKRFNKHCKIQSSIWLLDERNPTPVEMLDSMNIMGPCSSNVAQDLCIRHTWLVEVKVLVGQHAHNWLGPSREFQQLL